jgi:phosphatidylglycerol:prolipoprotein diacylglycerol transferase
MHPLLFMLGPIPVHTYGFLIALGFLCGLQILKKLAIREKFNVDRILDLAFSSLIVGMVGARLLFIVTRFDSFFRHPLDMFKLWEGGLVFFGGPLLVVPFIVWRCKVMKLPLWSFGDIGVFTLVLTHSFGRLGCLAAGCCYGKPTGTSYGVRLYSELVDPQLRGIPLHPTQLYESGALFILLGILYWIYQHKKFDGQVLLSYFLLYPIIRSIIEVYRGDSIRGFVIEDVLSTSQFISIVIFTITAVLFVRRYRTATRLRQS